MRWRGARPRSSPWMQTGNMRRKRSRRSSRRRCMIPMPSSSAPAVHTTKMLQLAVRRESRRRFLDLLGSRAAIEDSQSGFRLYPAGLLRTVTLKHGLKQSFVYESEVLIEASRHGVQCLHIPINVAPRIGSRPSHFRPVLDIVRITRMVAWKILQRGLYPRGLLASIRSSPSDVFETSGTDVCTSAHVLVGPVRTPGEQSFP